MVKGSLCVSEGIIRCPWHGACFNLKNGDIEDFPGLDPLQYFPVQIENGDVYVSGHYDQLSSSKSSKIKSLKGASSIVKPNVQEGGTIVVIGGGGAAQVCVETLRRRTDNPWQGRIIIITQEQSLPYDRPKVSKTL